jgi:hypothetical protein
MSSMPRTFAAPLATPGRSLRAWQPAGNLLRVTLVRERMSAIPDRECDAGYVGDRLKALLAWWHNCRH